MRPGCRPPLLLSAALAVGAAPLALAAPVTVQVAVADTAESTRLVLTHSARADFVIEAARRRVTILYTDPVALEAVEEPVEETVLRRLRQADERTLVVECGPDYESYESFALQNPFRLVLDLRRRGRDGARRQAPPEPRSLPRRVVVLDPGHGGTETGARGPAGLVEKDVTLALARSLARAIHETDPTIAVVLTRDEDRLVGLDERTAIANHNKADLFLSIHLNAAPRANATGAETYYLATEATDHEARTLAALENRALDEAPVRDGDSPAGALDLVLWDLAQNRYVAESSVLAESIQRHMNRLTGTRDRGVRQAPFRVLMGAMMPAVLVEVGFVSSAAEEQRLASPDYQQQVVQALAAAVREFLSDVDRQSGPAARGAAPDAGLP
jgi:N-acetylmuramoyl-L-alanine amidase